MKFIFDNGNQNACRHGAPDLCLDCVLAVVLKLLDAHVLFDPFEKQFDLPAVFVEGCNRQWLQREIIGQEDECFSGDGGFVTDTSQVLITVLRGMMFLEQDKLIANSSCRAVGSLRVNSPCGHLVLDACHEECACMMHLKQPPEVEVPAIHHIERTGLDEYEVQHLDLAYFPPLVRMNAGIAPHGSNNVCSLMAAFAQRNGAHSNMLKHRSIVVTSRAYPVILRFKPPRSVSLYSLRARRISPAVKSNQMRQSQDSLASTSVDRCKL